MINPCFSTDLIKAAVCNVLLFVAQVSPQHTPPTRQDVAIRAILASGCHTQQVIPWRACTTNCPAITITTWRHSCLITRSNWAAFTMYTPCICELVQRQCILLTTNRPAPIRLPYRFLIHTRIAAVLSPNTPPTTSRLNNAYANFRNQPCNYVLISHLN